MSLSLPSDAPPSGSGSLRRPSCAFSLLTPCYPVAATSLLGYAARRVFHTKETGQTGRRSAPGRLRAANLSGVLSLRLSAACVGGLHTSSTGQTLSVRAPGRLRLKNFSGVSVGSCGLPRSALVSIPRKPDNLGAVGPWADFGGRNFFGVSASVCVGLHTCSTGQTSGLPLQGGANVRTGRRKRLAPGQGLHRGRWCRARRSG